MLCFHLFTAIWSNCFSAVNALVWEVFLGEHSVGAKHTGRIRVSVSEVCTLIEWDRIFLLANPRRLNKGPLRSFLQLKWTPMVRDPSLIQTLQKMALICNFEKKKSHLAGWINNSHLCLRYFSGLWKWTGEGGRLPVSNPSPATTSN